MMMITLRDAGDAPYYHFISRLIFADATPLTPTPADAFSFHVTYAID